MEGTWRRFHSGVRMRCNVACTKPGRSLGVRLSVESRLTSKCSLSRFTMVLYNDETSEPYKSHTKHTNHTNHTKIGEPKIVIGFQPPPRSVQLLSTLSWRRWHLEVSLGKRTHPPPQTRHSPIDGNAPPLPFILSAKLPRSSW